ncbi:heme A synthase [Leucobacter sp. OH2974_COT-288]|nr:heme A synthase [Leucobacter sp. OH2974_COT-288]
MAQPRTSQTPGKFLRFTAWLSFVLNVVIIGTGGAVRLTGSGLGCSEWPLCTKDSLVTTPEMGIHGLIEFGNRTISGPILLAAIIVLVLSLRLQLRRKELTVLAATVLGLVLTQALLGGMVVWFHLNANLVGVHYFLSVVLVAITAAYLVRMYEPAGPRVRAVSPSFASFTHLTSFMMLLAVIFGIFTTGAGPHSGDISVIRDGFDASLLAHLHSWPGYITAGLLILLVVWSIQAEYPTTRWGVALLLLMTVQILVGVYQARNGLPAFAVGVHMVLASLTVATLVVLIMRMKTVKTAF